MQPHQYLASATRGYSATSDSGRFSMADQLPSPPPGTNLSLITAEGEPVFDPAELHREVFPSELPPRPAQKASLLARLFKRRLQRYEDIEMCSQQEHPRCFEDDRQFRYNGGIPIYWVVSSLLILIVLAALAWGLIALQSSEDTIPNDVLRYSMAVMCNESA